MHDKAAQPKEQWKCKYSGARVKSPVPVFFPSRQMGGPPEIIEDDLKQGNDTARNRHYGKRREKFVKSLFLHLTIIGLQIVIS